jgi:hypothetical protein
MCVRMNAICANRKSRRLLASTTVQFADQSSCQFRRCSHRKIALSSAVAVVVVLLFEKGAYVIVPNDRIDASFI